HARPASVRWLAFAAFLGVLAQAILGGLRVTVESGGDPNTATTLRVVHGCFAHLELSLVVALAAMLSPVWPQISPPAAGRSIAVRFIRPAALLVALVAAQVVLGIYIIWQMRPPVLTTLHVVNGAALLAATVLLAVRAGRGRVAADETSPSVSGGRVAEVTA